MDYLAKFEKASESDDPEKLKIFQMELEVAIEAYAEITDYLKKQQYRWNKNTEELCILRSMIQNKLKEKKDDPNRID